MIRNLSNTHTYWISLNIELLTYTTYSPPKGFVSSKDELRNDETFF